ncbi:PQQ-binding-like beta-propeller repeat protein [Mycobacterium sp. CBMA271]|uniref:outer membrane protein assembly factor BamB family protein n=1 Tax=Mycobacteroides sp. CBMA 271 TaxID=2606608 RepID=UPI0012DF3AAD|nr:PQQ-binding-like beta-propeller repeat protein [Mycobacteroides sp. CBMA 271]MUM22019.1 PQQ-binding-like beta-propeller repeat protein [Mycobacteroides sp. CBMA 271]
MSGDKSGEPAIEGAAEGEPDATPSSADQTGSRRTEADDAGPSLVRRSVAGLGVGFAAAAAIAAIVLMILAIVLRPATDLISARTTLASWLVLVAAAVVLVGTAARPKLRTGGRSTLAGVVGVEMIVVAAVVVPLWLGGFFDDLGISRFVDTTGVTVLWRAAILTVLSAVVIGAAVALFKHKVPLYAVISAFVVAVLVISAVCCWATERYRSSVWYPSLTAIAATPAAVPDALGVVRYKLRPELGPRAASTDTADIYPVGNGFVTYEDNEVVAYDGPTGVVRWRATGFGTLESDAGHSMLRSVNVAWRDRDDRVGIVVLLVGGGLVALDGSSGKVLWRRQYDGDYPKVTGWVDALAIATRISTGPVDDKTRLDSLDPRTGQVRWSRELSCSTNLSEGVSGQFISNECGSRQSSLVDAYTGNILGETDHGWLDVSADNDVYVTEPATVYKWPDAKDVTSVIDSTGHVIDKITGAIPVGRAFDGYLLLSTVGQIPVLRNYRTHESAPLRLAPFRDPYFTDAAWLQHRLVINTGRRAAGDPMPLHVLDPARVDAEPITSPSPCGANRAVEQIKAVPGAVVASCGGGDDVAPLIVGLTSPG